MCFFLIFLTSHVFAIRPSKWTSQHTLWGFGGVFPVRVVGLRSCSRIAGWTDCCWIECHTFYALWGVFLVRVVGLRSCLRTASRIGCRWIECSWLYIELFSTASLTWLVYFRTASQISFVFLFWRGGTMYLCLCICYVRFSQVLVCCYFQWQPRRLYL